MQIVLPNANNQEADKLFTNKFEMYILQFSLPLPVKQLTERKTCLPLKINTLVKKNSKLKI